MKRPVEFTQSLDAFEQKLSAELTEAEGKKLQLEQELLRIQSALPTANEEHANAKASLHRFDIFQQRFSKSDILHCPCCYVLHEELSPLVEVEQSENQFTKYRCNCGYEIAICKIDGP
jgi:hypothetical protein